MSLPSRRFQMLWASLWFGLAEMDPPATAVAAASARNGSRLRRALLDCRGRSLSPRASRFRSGLRSTRPLSLSPRSCSIRFHPDETQAVLPVRGRSRRPRFSVHRADRSDEFISHAVSPDAGFTGATVAVVRQPRGRERNWRRRNPRAVECVGQPHGASRPRRAPIVDVYERQFAGGVRARHQVFERQVRSERGHHARRRRPSDRVVPGSEYRRRYARRVECVRDR
jgi:hypothetical protein